MQDVSAAGPGPGPGAPAGLGRALPAAPGAARRRPGLASAWCCQSARERAGLLPGNVLGGIWGFLLFF